jgi:hypothetical protein
MVQAIECGFFWRCETRELMDYRQSGVLEALPGKRTRTR